MKNLSKKIRSRKLNSRVDLTAMVSVSFLLIIFFMVSTELRKPKIMALGLPERPSDEWDGVIRCYGGVSDRTITVLLDGNNKIITHYGNLFNPIENPKKLDYGKNGIRKELYNKKRQIYKYTGNSDRGAIVIIKPSKNCNFKNLVDILDEMAISKIDTYTIVNDFTPEETKLLASK